jgi:predicted DNA-binding transcriptional regulator AlpA
MGSDAATASKEYRVPEQHHLDRRVEQLLAAAPEADDLLNTKQVAAWLGVSTQWLEIGRCKGFGPPSKKIGPRLVRYQRSEVRAWLRQRRTHFARTVE